MVDCPSPNHRHRYHRHFVLPTPLLFLVLQFIVIRNYHPKISKQLSLDKLFEYIICKHFNIIGANYIQLQVSLQFHKLDPKFQKVIFFFLGVISSFNNLLVQIFLQIFNKSSMNYKIIFSIDTLILSLLHLLSRHALSNFIVCFAR